MSSNYFKELCNKELKITMLFAFYTYLLNTLPSILRQLMNAVFLRIDDFKLLC